MTDSNHGTCYKCGNDLTRIEARDRSHKCAPHPLAEVKAFQKRERAKRKAGRAHVDPWIEHPDFPVSDWQYEVANNDTRRGYAYWVAAKMEERSHG